MTKNQELEDLCLVFLAGSEIKGRIHVWPCYACMRESVDNSCGSPEKEWALGLVQVLWGQGTLRSQPRAGTQKGGG